MTSISTFLEERNYNAGKNALDTLVEVKEDCFLINFMFYRFSYKCEYDLKIISNKFLF